MNIGSKIKKYRELNNMSQLELAEELNITQRGVSAWEVGRTTPRFEMLIKLCNVFKCTVDEFMEDVDSPKSASEINLLAERQNEPSLLIEDSKKAQVDYIVMVDSKNKKENSKAEKDMQELMLEIQEISPDLQEVCIKRLLAYAKKFKELDNM